MGLAPAKAVGRHRQLVPAVGWALSGRGCKFLRLLWHLKAELRPQSSCKDLGSVPGPELYSDTTVTLNIGSVQ